MYRIFFVFLLFPCFCLCQSAKDLDIKNGFKDIKFDTPIDILKRSISLRRVHVSEHFIIEQLSYKKEMYQINDVKYLQVGDIPIESVEIIISYGKITHIAIAIDNWISNSGKVLKMLNLLYGEPTETIDLMDLGKQYLWAGNQISLNMNNITMNNKISIVIANTKNSTYAFQRMENEKKSLFEKSAKDF